VRSSVSSWKFAAQLALLGDSLGEGVQEVVRDGVPQEAINTADPIDTATVRAIFIGALCPSSQAAEPKDGQLDGVQYHPGKEEQAERSGHRSCRQRRHEHTAQRHSRNRNEDAERGAE
jgi:hypothetical protein